MTEFFDEAKWTQAISKPDWYVRLYPELTAFRERWEKDDSEAAHRLKREVRTFFQKALETRSLTLGSSGPNLDAERRPIDTIVIHHTSAQPGYDLSFMNATQLLNVYVPAFNNPDSSHGELKGQPMWSNHVRDGRPVFYLYHWLLRMDGPAERLLEDQELGWHAANWDINCRSVGICLDNDYDHMDPTPDTIAQLAKFIADTYPHVAPDRIFGHCEVSAHHTSCPGNSFVNGWKPQLIKMVEAARV